MAGWAYSDGVSYSDGLTYSGSGPLPGDMGLVASTPPHSPPRVRLDLTAPTGYADADLTIVRTTPDGLSAVVRSAEGITIVGSLWVGFDYEAPLGVPVTYTATVSGVGPAVSYTSTPITLVSDSPWLIHAGIPALSMAVPGARIMRLDARRYAVSQGVVEVHGRPDPIVRTDGRRKTAATALIVRTRTDDEAAAMRRILDDTSPLLLNVPATLGWGLSYEWIAVGDVEESRPFETADTPVRQFTLPYRVVAAPIGAVEAERTWATVLAEFDTWDELLDAHDTWLSLIAPVEA